MTRDGPAPTCRTLIESRVATVVIHAAGSSIGPSWRVRRKSASWATSSASETLPSIRYATPKPCRRSASSSLSPICRSSAHLFLLPCNRCLTTS